MQYRPPGPEVSLLNSRVQAKSPAFPFQEEDSFFSKGSRGVFICRAVRKRISHPKVKFNLQPCSWGIFEQPANTNLLHNIVKAPAMWPIRSHGKDPGSRQLLAPALLRSSP